MKRNAISPLKPGFHLDPYRWVEGTVLEDHCSEEDAGFFHVTTNRDRVFKQGLRARSETGIMGLGGGGGSDARGQKVSFVINYPRALWLFAAMRGLLSAQDEDAATVLRLVLEWTGFPGDIWSFNWDEDEGGGWERQADDLSTLCEELGLEPPDDILSLAFGSQWEKTIEEQRTALGMRWATPERRYELVQFFEARLRSTFSTDDWWDGGVCMPIVGFTASAKKYLSLSPRQFSIVQAAVADGAPNEDIPQECEMRFASKDIQVVAIDCQEQKNVIPIPPRFDD